MNSNQSALLKFCRDESGATAVEYAVLASLVIAVCVAIIYSLGGKTLGLFKVFSTAYP